MTDRPAPAHWQPLKCNGVGVDADCPSGGAVTVYFDRKLTDDEVRDFHDACRRLAPNLPRFEAKAPQ